jgi:AcrR family transcriptional regulator
MTDQARVYHHGDLRAALLDEAAAMIAEGGAASVTMRALGRRLGVSRAAAYRHFEDKTALLVAVATAGFGRLKDRLQAVDAGAPRSSVERIRRMGEEYVRFALENPAHYRLMYGAETYPSYGRPETPCLNNWSM